MKPLLRGSRNWRKAAHPGRSRGLAFTNSSPSRLIPESTPPRLLWPTPLTRLQPGWKHRISCSCPRRTVLDRASRYFVDGARHRGPRARCQDRCAMSVSRHPRTLDGGPRLRPVSRIDGKETSSSLTSRAALGQFRDSAIGRLRKWGAETAERRDPPNWQLVKSPDWCFLRKG